MARLLLSLALGAGASCDGLEGCQAQLHSLSERLNASQASMKARSVSLGLLESLRVCIASGEPVELPSDTREHLQSAGVSVNAFSLDAKHRPVSTNASRHLQRVRTIAAAVEVRFHAFLPLKKRGGKESSATAGPLLVSVDAASRLWVHDLDSQALLDGFDLGHEAKVQRLQLSHAQDSHFVLTADEKGNMHVHALKVVQHKVNASDGGHQRASAKLTVTANRTTGFKFLEPELDDAPRSLTSVMPVEGRQGGFVAGDDRGGISVFQKNGTLKGRVMVTADPGGVKGLQPLHSKSGASSVFFWSSHSFGFFSAPQLDVQSEPCDGWQSPVHGAIAIEGHRVVLALEDGDVLMFSTMHGKSKVCDLVLKFPRVSQAPFELQLYQGHVVALPVRPQGSPRDLHFFNLAAMDQGYGASRSQALALQASFEPQQPVAFVMHSGGGGESSQSRGLMALRMAEAKGIELFEVALKNPRSSKGMGSGSGAFGDESSSDSMLDWFTLPKIGIFGIVLVLVVMWNVRKVYAQKKPDRKDKLDSFDEEDLQKHEKDRKAKRDAQEREHEKLREAAAGEDAGDGVAN